ncbi:MAG: hypothetical protein QM820_34175 [Minicystis sp.]
MSSAASPPLTQARRFGWPAPDLYRIASLTEDDVRACWEFRRGFMDLKPHVDPAQDWKKYEAWVRTADFAWLPRDPDGRLRSTFFYKVEARRHEGRPCVLIQPEYGYSCPDARSTPGYALALLAALVLGVGRAPGAPHYIVGPGYLSSYTSLCQSFDDVFVAEDPAMTPWEKSLYRTLAAATPGYDASRGVIDMVTIPRNPRTDPPRDPRLLGPWRRYLAQNPRWTEGHTCLVFGRCPPKAILSGLKWLARRAR